VLAVIYGSRFALLKLMTTPVDAGLLLWIAPRGLITVLLFLEARDAFELPGYLNGAVMLVVLGSSAMILATRKVRSKQPSSEVQ
jgi:cell volume regulation protein A